MGSLEKTARFGGAERPLQATTGSQGSHHSLDGVPVIPAEIIQQALKAPDRTDPVEPDLARTSVGIKRQAGRFPAGAENRLPLSLLRLSSLMLPGEHIA
ncbi:hypothetical protein BCL93_103156 [Onishia taeanensis]|uniref:Uncharacterized protein n=1 Tax=Onishia taeanensis TaxID=284577 RepID=A0A328XVD3_9GAMM|nr:hypothetical protein BCL93_103156 [Halomonas taeanensis]